MLSQEQINETWSIRSDNYNKYVLEELRTERPKAWLERIEKYAVPQLFAPDPHKLMRAIEDLSVLEYAKIILTAMKERKSTMPEFSFERLDYPELDEADRDKYLLLTKVGDKVEFERRPIRFWGNMKEQYEAHNKDYTGVYKPEG